MSGQINLDSNMGKYLFSLASDITLENFVEIGTWNGLGSTNCITRGLLTRQSDKPGRLWSLEINKDLHDQAKAHWDNIPDSQNVLSLLYGHILDPSKIATSSQIMSGSPQFQNEKQHFDQNYEIECHLIKDTPNVLNQLPQKIDVLLLDGGYDAFNEFEVLKERVKIIVCDDTQFFKCFALVAHLKNSGCYVCLENRSNERHGWAAFQKSSLI